MQKSGFFTSVGGDRKYGADWLAQFTASIISNGVYTTELTVSGNGNMSVSVGPGRAWINGYMYLSDSALTLPLSAADGALSRTDLVVLRLDRTNRQITLAVVQGDFGGGVPVLTRTSDLYELCLARIAVAAGTTQVTAQLITDTRADETVCGIVAGAVTQLSTGELLEQLKAGFDTWFDAIKGQLSADAAGNLQNQINEKLPLSGGTLSGPLLLHANPTENLHAVTKQYADAMQSTVKLKEIVTTSSAQQIDLDVTDINWNNYRWVEICVEAIGTTAPNGSVRLNGLSGENDYLYTNEITYSSISYLCPFYNTYNSNKIWTRLVLFGRASKVSGYCQQIGTNYADWHFMGANASLRLSSLTTVNFISSASLLTGSTITVYGVMK